VGVGATESSQPKGVKSKLRDRNLCVLERGVKKKT